MAETVLGIIGGSGFYQMPGLERVEQIELDTPFGAPSDSYVRGSLGGITVVFLSRHGRGHRVMPSEINYRANIYGMKQLGVQQLLSISAAGSMRENLAPGDFFVPDQFIDRTFKRPQSFFGNGIVGHVSMADPVCPHLATDLTLACRAAGATVTQGGTYLSIEGPQFSTRAESQLYRSWKVDVISMTAVQEARLAREAELCYAILALVTDYDCWHLSEKEVDIGDVIQVLGANVTTARAALSHLAARLAVSTRSCSCAQALKGAIVTERSVIPRQTRAALDLLIGKYL
ncbi:MAG TPA: S-methyl-5'-thioadenosine phosphorylase [Candidatus Binataceae bacterium]|nr:S-methyl-5'-thioadenosine phosphorylase [Candidatus Binataceae bacterium]